jgi:EmrB/QacA subfamily drug resistance transporter
VTVKSRGFGSVLLHVPRAHRRAECERERGAGSPAAVLVTGCLLLFMIGVNTTAINTALNAVAEDLHMGTGELAWSVGIYLLAVAAFVVLGGRLGDLFGQRTVVLAGLCIYAAGAVMVAASGSAALAIAGRAVQGLGGAVLMPASMAVLRIAYPPERQGFALGIWGAVGGAAFALGPLIGGAATDTIGWRWIWWGTAVFAGLVVWLSLATLRGMPRPSERPLLDWAGIVLLPICLFSLVLAIQQGPAWGWTSAKTLAAFALALVATIALVVVELRKAAPLLHLKLLRLPPVIGANLGTAVNALGLIGMLFFFNLYAQSIFTLDYSAVTASVALLPYGFSILVASLAIGRICDRVGFRWPVAAGLAMMGAGILIVSRVDASSGYGHLWWSSIIVGLGVGATMSAPSAAGLRAVGDQVAGEVSGIINVARYLAAALVVAIGGIVFTAVAADDLNDHLESAGLPTVERQKLDDALTGAQAQVTAVEQGLDPAQLADFSAGGPDGVAGGFSAVMLGIGVIALLAVPPWLWLMRRPAA